jgi:proteic killer suppression protein
MDGRVLISFKYYKNNLNYLDTYRVTLYTFAIMIKSFKHKGLEQFFITGSKKGINPDHFKKLERILDRLDASIQPSDMNLPAYKLHPLFGNKKGRWSVWINGNWRLTFEFERENAIKVDYEDYH